MNCRHCKHPLNCIFADLGFAPPSNAYLTRDELNQPEMHYPLRVFLCDSCWLVQTEDLNAADQLFTDDYAYFSSTSTSWLEHARRYRDSVVDQLNLGPDSLVIEIASNDGYLLQFFGEHSIPCLGIEPTASTAAKAVEKGLATIQEFFGSGLARVLGLQGKQADLIVGNNVYAHVPDINDFTRGLKLLLKPAGTITLEFPHLMRLIEGKQFDTIYHEHFSYLSLGVVANIFERFGLRIFDVEEISTHGGSLRVYGCHDDDPRKRTVRCRSLLRTEQDYGLFSREAYNPFQREIDSIKNGLLKFLIEQKEAGRVVAGYGAAAKGNTLLNYAGVKSDLLPVICDNAPAKQGKYMPGSHIPIVPPNMLSNWRPDSILILPWNIAREIVTSNDDLRSAGCRFFTAVPEVAEVT